MPALKWPICQTCYRRHNPDLTLVDHYGRNRKRYRSRMRKFMKRKSHV